MDDDTAYAERFATGAGDFDRMYDLAVAVPGDALHVADLPWRLTSPSAQVSSRTHLWEDADGALAAWAVLQYPAWHCLDYVVRPDARIAGLEPMVLAWACARLETEAAAHGGRLPFYVSARHHDEVGIAAIEHAGFVREQWGYVHLSRDLDEAIPASILPPGFIVRALAGGQEVDAYVAAHRAAFDTANMTADWRRTVLFDSHYVPELDLVAVAPDGSLAGFCVCWMTPVIDGQQTAQIEPLGILPSYQRLGLGRALLLEGLRRAKNLETNRMDVKAESHNAASQGVYEAVGFRTLFDEPFFLQQFG